MSDSKSLPRGHKPQASVICLLLKCRPTNPRRRKHTTEKARMISHDLMLRAVTVCSELPCMAIMSTLVNIKHVHTTPNQDLQHQSSQGRLRKFPTICFQVLSGLTSQSSVTTSENKKDEERSHRSSSRLRARTDHGIGGTRPVSFGKRTCFALDLIPSRSQHSPALPAIRAAHDHD